MIASEPLKETYLFEGVVYPERAQLSLNLGLRFSHIASGKPAEARISVILNKVAVWVDTYEEWDVYDLRNVVRTMLQNEISFLGFFKGFSYEVEVTRVLNRKLNVDFIFGIDIACITERCRSVSDENIAKLRDKFIGVDGIFFHRSLNDFIAAMKNADDTGFYCYRAIESLRQQCARKYDIDLKNKGQQWEKLREISGTEETILREIKSAADPTRHGDVHSMDSTNRAALLTKTWNIIKSYLDHS